MNEAEEHELRIELMEADIANKRADTAYKQGLLRFEPWKIVIAALAAGSILFGALGGLVGYKIGSTPPQPIVIQLPPAK